MEKCVRLRLIWPMSLPPTSVPMTLRHDMLLSIDLAFLVRLPRNGLYPKRRPPNLVFIKEIVARLPTTRFRVEIVLGFSISQGKQEFAHRSHLIQPGTNV